MSRNRLGRETGEVERGQNFEKYCKKKQNKEHSQDVCIPQQTIHSYPSVTPRRLLSFFLYLLLYHFTQGSTKVSDTALRLKRGVA